MVTAMKAKDADTLSTLRMLKAALMEAKTKKAKDETLSADEEIDVLQRYVKKRRETIEEMRKLGREDLSRRRSRRDRRHDALPAAARWARTRLRAIVQRRRGLDRRRGSEGHGQGDRVP